MVSKAPWTDLLGGSCSGRSDVEMGSCQSGEGEGDEKNSWEEVHGPLESVLKRGRVREWGGDGFGEWGSGGIGLYLLVINVVLKEGKGGSAADGTRIEEQSAV